jgi:hypothetical protein
MVWCHNPGLHLRVPCAVVAAVWIVVGLVVGIPAGINRFSDHYWVPEPVRMIVFICGNQFGTFCMQALVYCRQGLQS